MRERFRDHSFVEKESIVRAIELTRFPVPEAIDHGGTATDAGYMRAADPIGQVGDPLYPRRLNALYHELPEVGLHEKLGYDNPADLAELYPAFFWSKVDPVIGDAILALDKTVEGRRWVANLYAHVFVIERDRRRMGTTSGLRPPSAQALNRRTHRRPVMFNLSARDMYRLLVHRGRTGLLEGFQVHRYFQRGDNGCALRTVARASPHPDGLKVTAMSRDRDAQRARAEAKLEKAETMARAGAEARAEHDAVVAARDANTERLKALRLTREAAERDAVASKGPSGA